MFPHNARMAYHQRSTYIAAVLAIGVTVIVGLAVFISEAAAPEDAEIHAADVTEPSAAAVETMPESEEGATAAEPVEGEGEEAEAGMAESEPAAGEGEEAEAGSEDADADAAAGDEADSEAGAEDPAPEAGNGDAEEEVIAPEAEETEEATEPAAEEETEPADQ